MTQISVTQINIRGRDHGGPDHHGRPDRGGPKGDHGGPKGKDRFDGMNMRELRHEMKKAMRDFKQADSFREKMQAFKQMSRIGQEMREERREAFRDFFQRGRHC